MHPRSIKLILASSALLLAVLACGVPSTATAVPGPTDSVVPATAAPTTPALPLATNPSLQTLDMLDANNGWGTGQNAVYRTADGGTTWFDATPSGIGGTPLAASFVDANHAWVVVPVSEPTSGTLYRTSDGGVTWTAVGVPFSAGSLHFVDATHGWELIGLNAGMSHESVAVYRSDDGGATWTRAFVNDPVVSGATDSLPLVGDKNGIAATDAMHAWVTGSEPVTDFIYVYTSADGGATWAQQNLPFPGGFSNTMTSAALPVFFGAEGVLPVQIFADTNATEFYASHDSGGTWNLTAPLNQGGFIAVGSQHDFFVWDGGATLHASHDGGSTWTTVSPNVNLMDKMMYFQFLGGSTGWALTGDSSDHHMLYKTTDGGATWTALIP
jgi:photosystem II stability/assembly factor-like uncharacterized protein